MNPARDPDPADGVATVARGLLLAFAAPSIAALACDSSRGAGAALGMTAELATLPALFALAGWLLAEPLGSARFGALLRAVLPGVSCGAGAAFVAAVAAPLAGADWRTGLALAAPALGLTLLPAAYALVARALRGSPVMLALAAFATHVVGVIVGKPALIYFVFFVAGGLLEAHRATLRRFVAEEREFAIAAAPFVAVLAIAVAIRFGQTGQPPSVAAAGPIALVLGLAAGPAVLVAAMAISATAFGEISARLGRAAPALAVLWIPLFSILIAAANRGLTPSIPAAILMAAASLLLIAVVADVILDATDRSDYPRTATRS